MNTHDKNAPYGPTEGTTPMAATPERPTAHPTDKPEWAMSPREKRKAAGQKSRRRWPWLILLLLAGGGFAFWTVQQQAAATAPEVAAAPAEALPMQINPDEMTVIAPQTLQQTVRVIGTLQPARQAQLSSQTSGSIETINVRPGDRVAQGDLLVQVDQETLSIELDLARSNAAATAAQLDLAEAQLARAETLRERGVGTTSSLDEARSAVTGLNANIRALQDQVQAAELRLRNARLQAPFDGIIAARDVEPGQFVQTGTPLLTLVDLSTVEMQANAPVATGALLQPGQAVSVSVDGIAGRSFDGTVTRINPVAAAGTRTIPVYVTLDNADGVLLGGMFATGQIVVAEAAEAIAVPQVALREDAEGDYVLKLEGETLVRQSVETADTWGDRLTAVTAGIAAGDTVLTAPLPELNAGDTVALVSN